MNMNCMSGLGSDGSLRHDIRPPRNWPSRALSPPGLEDKPEQRVVVQILPDAGQVADDADADLAEARAAQGAAPAARADTWAQIIRTM
jgi:hypothetical protein